MGHTVEIAVKRLQFGFSQIHGGKNGIRLAVIGLFGFKAVDRINRMRFVIGKIYFFCSCDLSSVFDNVRVNDIVASVFYGHVFTSCSVSVDFGYEFPFELPEKAYGGLCAVIPFG